MRNSRMIKDQTDLQDFDVWVDKIETRYSNTPAIFLGVILLFVVAAIIV